MTITPTATSVATKALRAVSAIVARFRRVAMAANARRRRDRARGEAGRAMLAQRRAGLLRRAPPRRRRSRARSRQAAVLALSGGVLLALPWPLQFPGRRWSCSRAAVCLRAVWLWERTRLVVTTEKVCVVDGTLRRRASRGAPARGREARARAEPARAGCSATARSSPGRSRSSTCRSRARLSARRAARGLMAEAPPVEVRGLTKRYGSTIAVDDLTFSIAAGRITGFLGPNGAGKSTTLRALLGLVRPTSGEARVEGAPYAQLHDPLGTVGAVLESDSFHPGRSGRNHLRVPRHRGGSLDGARGRSARGRSSSRAPARRRVGGLLARHAPAAERRRCAAGTAAAARARRAGQRARPGGDPLAARLPALLRRRGRHGADLEPRAARRSPSSWTRS